jgi:hypothetical protein
LEVVDRNIDGENELRVGREHRGVSAKQLAEATGPAAPGALIAIRNSYREPFSLRL